MKKGGKEFRSSSYYELLEHKTRKLSEYQIFCIFSLIILSLFCSLIINSFMILKFEWIELSIFCIFFTNHIQDHP